MPTSLLDLDDEVIANFVLPKASLKSLASLALISNSLAKLVGHHITLPTRWHQQAKALKQAIRDAQDNAELARVLSGPLSDYVDVSATAISAVEQSGPDEALSSHNLVRLSHPNRRTPTIYYYSRSPQSRLTGIADLKAHAVVEIMYGGERKQLSLVLIALSKRLEPAAMIPLIKSLRVTLSNAARIAPDCCCEDRFSSGYCAVQSQLRAVVKEGANKGREFYTCPKARDQSCPFFEWASPAPLHDYLISRLKPRAAAPEYTAHTRLQLILDDCVEDNPRGLVGGCKASLWTPALFYDFATATRFTARQLGSIAAQLEATCARKRPRVTSELGDHRFLLLWMAAMHVSEKAWTLLQYELGAGLSEDRSFAEVIAALPSTPRADDSLFVDMQFIGAMVAAITREVTEGGGVHPDDHLPADFLRSWSEQIGFPASASSEMVSDLLAALRVQNHKKEFTCHFASVGLRWVNNLLEDDRTRHLDKIAAIAGQGW